MLSASLLHLCHWEALSAKLSSMIRFLETHRTKLIDSPARALTLAVSNPGSSPLAVTAMSKITVARASSGKQAPSARATANLAEGMLFTATRSRSQAAAMVLVEEGLGHCEVIHQESSPFCGDNMPFVAWQWIG